MVKINLDGCRVDLTCSKCGNQFQDVVSRVNGNLVATCPWCSLEMRIREDSIPDVKPFEIRGGRIVEK